MTNTIPFPTTLLPAPSFAFSINTQSAITRTTIQGGKARQRRRTRKPTNLVTATWELDSTQISIFRSWFEDALKNGENWFTIPLKLSRSSKIFQMRFTQGYTTNHVPVNNWSVNASLEIDDLLDVPFGEIEAAVLYFWEHPASLEFTPTMTNRELFQSFTLDEDTSHTFNRINSSSDVVITLPSNPTFDVDSYFSIFSRIGDGQVIFEAEDTNVIIDSDLGAKRIDNKYTVATIHYVANNRYHIYGDLRT